MYRTVLVGSFVALLAAALACAALAVAGSEGARRDMARTAAARQVLEAHLEIEAAIFHLFKQLTDEVLTDDGLVDPNITVAQARVAAQIDTTRRLIAREVALPEANEDEADEFGRLAEIERIVAEAFIALRAIDAADGGADEAVVERVLERLIDSDLRALIDAATAEERREVAEIEAATAERLDTVARLAKIAGALALLVCVLGGAVLLRRLVRPLSAFDAAAAAIAAGEHERRIPDLGRDEFGTVARSLNRMLDGLAARRAAVEDQRAGLEATVAERTQALAAANAALTRADETRRRFLADVSHELRTPLTIIRGEAEVTLRARAAGEDEYRAALTRVAEEAAVTARLVDDLLFVARAETGEPRLARAETPLAALARRAAQDAAVTAVERDVRVAFSATAEPTVVGDAGRLRQLAMILIDNAVRYSHRGGVVEVGVGLGPAVALLSVRDEGVGIAPEDLPRVFDRFHRGANAVAMNADGSGLGLAMAKSIAEAHGGTITVESILGVGATFTVALPLAGRLRAVA